MYLNNFKLSTQSDGLHVLGLSVMAFGQVDQNQRLFPLPLAHEIMSQCSDRLESNQLIGCLYEFGYPTGLDVIEMDKASHLIEHLYLDGNILKMNIKCLNTYHGKFLKTLFETECHDAIETMYAGTGTLIFHAANEDQNNRDEYDYKLLKKFNLTTVHFVKSGPERRLF